MHGAVVHVGPAHAGLVHAGPVHGLTDGVIPGTGHGLSTRQPAAVDHGRPAVVIAAYSVAIAAASRAVFSTSWMLAARLSPPVSSLTRASR